MAITIAVLKEYESELIWNRESSMRKSLLEIFIFLTSFIVSALGFAEINKIAGFGFNYNLALAVGGGLVLILEFGKMYFISEIIKNKIGSIFGVKGLSVAPIGSILSAILFTVLLFSLDIYSVYSVSESYLNTNDTNSKATDTEFQNRLNFFADNKISKSRQEVKIKAKEDELQAEYDIYKKSITAYHTKRDEFSKIAPKLKEWKTTNQSRYAEIEILKSEAKSLKTTMSKDELSKFENGYKDDKKIITGLIIVFTFVVFGFMHFGSITTMKKKYYNFINRDKLEDTAHQKKYGIYLELKKEFYESKTYQDSVSVNEKITTQNIEDKALGDVKAIERKTLRDKTSIRIDTTQSNELAEVAQALIKSKADKKKHIDGVNSLYSQNDTVNSFAETIIIPDYELALIQENYKMNQMKMNQSTQDFKISMANYKLDVKVDREKTKEPTPTKKIGFESQIDSLDKQILQSLYKGGNIKKGEKLVSNQQISTNTKIGNYIRELNKELVQKSIVGYENGRGYFAKMEYKEALNLIG